MSSAQTRTVKIRNLRREPTVTVCIDGGRGDARYVVFYGKAELIEPGERRENCGGKLYDTTMPTKQRAERYYETVRDTEGAIIALRAERTVLSGFGRTES